MQSLFSKVLLRLLPLGLGLASLSLAQSSYLPLAEGAKWVLKSRDTEKPIILEVLSRDGQGYRIRFSGPFGSSDWTLEPKGEKVLMTKYGKEGQMMDLPADQVYFDFSAKKGQRWKMTNNQMSVIERDLNIQTRGGSYSQAIRIKQGKDLVFTFAAPVGFVQLGEGKGAFLLDEAASSIPGLNASSRPAATNSNRADDNRPVAHVPGTSSATPAPSARENSRNARASRPMARSGGGPVLFGITVNATANEPQTPTNLLKRWNESLDQGVNFVVSNGKWNELETTKGKFNLDPIRFQVFEAKKHNLQVAYTLRLIDTVARTMPKDLEKKKWSDPEMEARLMRLIEALASEFQDRVKWFMFGNEIDGYFAKNTGEVAAYASLYEKVERRLKELVPGIQVSSTIMFGGIESLDGLLRPLNDQFDFLAITYYPIRGDFTMKPPSIVSNDFGIMRKQARGRSVVLQEIGYSSSSLNQSSPEQQAEFLRNIFEAVKANRDMIAAGSYFMMSDFTDQFTRDLANFYGIKNYKIFDSFLQTNGLFDTKGNPKPAWKVFQTEMRNLPK